MKLKFFNEIKENEFEIIISGEFGWSVDGKQVANEIRYLNKQGATKITQRINSGGGSVIDAYDIVDANVNSKAIIETIITGIAGSAAGWVAATGTNGNRKIVDYGVAMIHDPSLDGETIEMTKEEKTKTSLLAIKESIATIFVNMTGKSRDEINDLMTKETWFSSDAWVSNGFADKVIKTNNKIKKENLSKLQIMNLCEKEGYKFITNSIELNTLNMKNLLNHLKLAEAANEQQIIEAIKLIETNLLNVSNELKISKDTITKLTSEKNALQIVIDGYKTSEKTANLEKVKAIIDEAVRAGKIREAEKAKWNETFGEDFAKAKIMVDSIVLQNADIINQINNSQNALIPAERKTWSFRDWEKRDAEGLAKIKNDNLTLYKEMYKLEYKVDYN